MQNKRRMSDKVFGSNLFNGILMIILTALVAFISFQFQAHLAETEANTLTNVKQDAVNERQDETLNILVKLIEKNGLKTDSNFLEIVSVQKHLNKYDYEIESIKKEISIR